MTIFFLCMLFVGVDEMFRGVEEILPFDEDKLLNATRILGGFYVTKVALYFFFTS